MGGGGTHGHTNDVNVARDSEKEKYGAEFGTEGVHLSAEFLITFDPFSGLDQCSLETLSTKKTSSYRLLRQYFRTL